MKPSLIVHGADNFIGARLIASLANEDWAMVRAVRAGDVDALRSGLPDAQAIAHCIVGSTAHIEGSATALYGLLSESATLRLVHLSSMTVYGSATGVVEESADPRADLGDYSMAQRTAEQRAAKHSNSVILRSGVEYGPTCVPWSGRVARWLQAHRLGDLGESGDGLCNLVYIDDLISVIKSAIREPGIGGNVFNVAVGNKPTWNDYFTAYSMALGAVPVRRIGARRLYLETRIVAPALKMAEMVAVATRLPWLRVAPPIPASLLRLCRQEIDLSVARVEGRLGARWTPLELGLRRTAECYR
jgi:2-alkyl-3-oxoalkanoate reductase